MLTHCIALRRRRIKCDEGHPCQACLTANSPCTFEEPGKRTHPHKSKCVQTAIPFVALISPCPRRTATLEDRMHQLETLIQAIPPAVFTSGGLTPPQHLAADPNMASPLSTFASMNHSFPSGVPPPSLHVFPLTNPSTHFTAPPSRGSPRQESPNTTFRSILGQQSHSQNSSGFEHPYGESSRLHASYLYYDDEGYTRWQGETSGLPLLDLLVENRTSVKSETEHGSPDPSWSGKQSPTSDTHTWFPNRTSRRTDVNPETLWRLITSYIVPELMDR